MGDGWCASFSLSRLSTMNAATKLSSTSQNASHRNLIGIKKKFAVREGSEVKRLKHKTKFARQSTGEKQI